MQWDAIVLAGGRARRMNAADKAQIEVAGRRLLDRTLEAVAGAQSIVVVGPGPVPDGVVLAREDPPFGGPAAAVVAGLAEVRAEWVLVAAVDHPFLADVVPLLVAGGDGSVLEASDGRRQLVFFVRTEALRAAAAKLGDPTGMSINTLLATLDLRGIVDDRSAADVDTWDDVARAEGHSGG